MCWYLDWNWMVWDWEEDSINILDYSTGKIEYAMRQYISIRVHVHTGSREKRRKTTRFVFSSSQSEHNTVAYWRIFYFITCGCLSNLTSKPDYPISKIPGNQKITFRYSESSRPRWRTPNKMAACIPNLTSDSNSPTPKTTRKQNLNFQNFLPSGG